ncbi:neuropeptide-like protein 31 isoform X2 [Folsomia candida]|uniref:neuropeptide-like protein 31 isoform X2 n=1 Tax=Folsomia candida TaxID=158441 RepID=UPI0016051B7F|nr:neuropeptide-like protein 31 isoform X2 [Folsomia candida]
MVKYVCAFLVVCLCAVAFAAELPLKEATSPKTKEGGDLQTDSSAFYGYAPYGIGYGYGGYGLGYGGYGGYGGGYGFGGYGYPGFGGYGFGGYYK